jgi:hypothetical protein
LKEQGQDFFQQRIAGMNFTFGGEGDGGAGFDPGHRVGTPGIPGAFLVAWTRRRKGFAKGDRMALRIFTSRSLGLKRAS